MTEQQPRVLLIDDEEDLCTLMQISLSRLGVQTDCAYTYNVPNNCYNNNIMMPA